MVKYEDVCTGCGEEVPELRRDFGQYFAVYNDARQRQALGYRAPTTVYAARGSCDLRLSLQASEG